MGWAQGGLRCVGAAREAACWERGDGEGAFLRLSKEPLCGKAGDGGRGARRALAAGTATGGALGEEAVSLPAEEGPAPERSRRGGRARRSLRAKGGGRPGVRHGGAAGVKGENGRGLWGALEGFWRLSEVLRGGLRRSCRGYEGGGWEGPQGL